MELSVFLSVLFAALLHAGWSTLVKRDSDPVAMSAAVSAMALVIAVPGLLVTGLPDPAAYPFLLGSAVIHCAYTFATAQSYRHGDLTMAYPVARGAAPALAAVAAIVWPGEMPGAAGWAGLACVTGGALLVAASAFRSGQGRGLAFACGAAVTIASYTLVDAAGARASGDAIAYTLALLGVCALANTAVFGLVLGPDVLRNAARRAGPGLGGAVLSAVAYGIALHAMTQAPVALVAALRESSIAWAVLFGVVFLGERPGRLRLAGAGLILAGAAVLRLG